MIQAKGWLKGGKTINSNLAGDNYMHGVPNISHNTAGTAEVMSTGYGHLWCIVPPRFFDADVQRIFCRVVNRGQKGVSGISDYELQKGSYTAGNNAEEIPLFTGGIKKNNNTFTVKFQETAAGLVRKLQHYWATGLADLESGYALYHGKIASGEFEYSMFNHTATFLYAMTDQSGGAGGKNSIQFACSWTWVFGDQVKNDHFNWNQGEHNAVETDWAFNGVYHETPSDYTSAEKMLKAQGVYLDSNDAYDPGSVVKAAVTAFVAQGTTQTTADGTFANGFNVAEQVPFQKHNAIGAAATNSVTSVATLDNNDGEVAATSTKAPAIPFDA